MRRAKMTALLSFALLALSSCGQQPRRAPILSAPPSAAADNDIYVGDSAGRIRAFRADGTEQWSYSLADDLARQDQGTTYDVRVNYLAARSGGKIFCVATLASGSRSGETILFALDKNHLLWQRTVPTPVQAVAPLAIGQDAVYEAGADGVLYAFARDDSHPLWQYRVSDGPLGSPTVGADGTVYIAGPRRNLHAIASDGSQRWVVETQK